MSNKEAPSDILALALAFYREPIRYRDLLQARVELSDGADILLRAATGSDNITEELRKAALFTIEQVFFAQGASHYRVLGLSRQATIEQIKTHHRLLMRLLHPDRNDIQETWMDAYAGRVNQAYNALRNPALRRAYDETLIRGAQRNQKSYNGSPRYTNLGYTAGVSKFDASPFARYAPILLNRLPQIVLVGSAVLGILFVAGVYLLNRSAAVSVRSNAVSAADVPVSPDLVSLVNDLGDIENTKVEAKLAAERETREREAKLAAEREAREREAKLAAEREAREREAKLAAERETQKREAKLAAEREAQKREARLAAEREAREREAKLAAEREAREREARSAAEREAQKREARLAAEREIRKREAKLAAEREARKREARLAAEREAQKREAKLAAEREIREREAKLAAEREAKLAAEREARKREARLAAEREARKREAKLAAEREARERQVKLVAEQEAKLRSAREAKTVAERTGQENSISTRDLQALIRRFVDTYERGDLEGFMALFDNQARSNSRNSKQAIKRDYEDLFFVTRARQIVLTGINWDQDEQVARGQGGIRLRLQTAAEQSFKDYAGTIRLEVWKRNGKIMIKGLYHEIK